MDGDVVTSGVCEKSSAVGWDAAVGWNVWCDGGGCAVHECDDGGGYGESGGHCSLACWELVVAVAVEVRLLAVVEVAATWGVGRSGVVPSRHAGGCKGSGGEDVVWLSCAGFGAPVVG